MRRFVCCVLALMLMSTGANAMEVPALSAKSVVLMDTDSGRVLYAHNEHEQRLIASTTKLMTALVALESGIEPDTRVSIKPEWTGIEGSSLYLKPGEELSLETLLYGLLLRSGNDAAHAVAGFCGPGAEAFVTRMNEKAAQLGMKNSSFENPSGLDGEHHYSTAYDMALLARACLENETLRKICATKTITLENRIFTNHNKLLRQYEGCIGLKTGYTERAGRTLVSAAQRDGMTLICVTLAAPNDWADHKALYDAAFCVYERNCLVREGEAVCQVPVEGSVVPVRGLYARRAAFAALSSGERVERKIELFKAAFKAPLAADEQVGDVVFSMEGREILRVPLYFDTNIPCDREPERWSFWDLFGR